MSETAKLDGAGDAAAPVRPANDNHRIVSEARVRTALAARYMSQLCKHFGHRVPVERSETDGRIRFPLGTCVLSAEGDVLALRIQSGASPEALAALEQIVAEHLARFAFRDKPEIAWVRVA